MPAKDPSASAAMIDSLEQQLFDLAVEFRSESRSQQTIIDEYAHAMDQLLMFPEWSGEPEIQSQLPRRFMPDSYIRYWDKRIGSVESIIHSEISAHPEISFHRTREGFEQGLEKVIEAYHLGVPFAEDTIEAASRWLGMFAIYLFHELDGERISELVFRICERVLWMLDIEVAEGGKEEFIEKLGIASVSGEDITLTLQRHCNSPAASEQHRARKKS